MTDETIYWCGVEYTYDIGHESHNELAGGFVYAFCACHDAQECINQLTKSFVGEGLSISKIEFVSPYDSTMEWEDQEQEQRYLLLAQEASTTDGIVFDDFYAHERKGS